MSRVQKVTKMLEQSSFLWMHQQQRWMGRACTTKLPVELLQDVEGLGNAGTIAKVSPGYARNFLIPNKLVAVRRGKQSGSIGGEGMVGGVDKETSAVSDMEKKRIEADRSRKRLQNVVKKLMTTTLKVRCRADKAGNLEKDVGAADVAEVIARQLQIEIVPELLDMRDSVIKTVGEYEIPTKLFLPGGNAVVLDVNITSNTTSTQ